MVSSKLQIAKVKSHMDFNANYLRRNEKKTKKLVHFYTLKILKKYRENSIPIKIKFI